MKENVNWVSWSKRELLIVLIVIVGLGWGLKYNFDLSAAKARDWERKEQAKRVINTLHDDYASFYGGFPPGTDQGEIRGCGDAVCPQVDGDGTRCLWGSGHPALTYSCENYTYFNLSPLPDNPDTSEPDQIKYARISNGVAVNEVCLELRSDPEGVTLDESYVGWTEDECPSGWILIWPEKRIVNEMLVNTEL